MSNVPRLRGDQTLALAREGYEFIGRRARRLQSDVFQGRLLGQRVTFLSGRDAAELFYDEERFRRAGETPWLVQKTLFGSGGVQTLDGDAHRQRKAMFLSLMTRENIARLLELSEHEWTVALSSWQRMDRVVLLEQAGLVLFRAASAWAVAPLSARRSQSLARHMAAMVDGFAALGPRLWRARVGRIEAERWARSMIRRVRDGKLLPPPGAAARVFAEALDADGARLPLQIAAVELLNVVRPITALAWWVSFMALALHEHPTWRERLAQDDDLLEPFVHELRRFYPFTPLLGARARRAFEWRGAALREGELALFDVYGTLRDPRLWDAPEAFRPQRFVGRELTPFDLLPQGGGDFLLGHRCAGEWLSIALLKQALAALVRTKYQLPAQDLSYRLSRVPCAPASGVILRDVVVEAPLSPRLAEPRRALARQAPERGPYMGGPESEGRLSS